ncbi:MAG: GNAT family N-acetyltransferase [Pseudomonadota bacterium]
MTSFDLTFATDADKDATASEIENQLLQSLAQTNMQARNENFVLKVASKNGGLLAGLTASTSYGWLLIKTLWVDESMRGTGLGRRLVEAAEQKGRELECGNAWLDTSNRDAREFYRNLGYEDFGKLKNGQGDRPSDHRRWFMKKSLVTVGPSPT